MWFHLLPLVLMNVSGICSDSCPVRTLASGPTAPSLELSTGGIMLVAMAMRRISPLHLSYTYTHSHDTHTDACMISHRH